MELNKKEFQDFHKAILDKFNERCREVHRQPPPSETGELYGYKPGYKGLSLAKDIAEYPPVEAYLVERKASIPHLKNFYEKRNDLENNRKITASIDNFYTDIFLRYLECSSEEELREKHLRQGDIKVNYKCFFYSFRLHDVRDFSLQINYGGYPYKVKEWGLHFENLETSEDRPIYEGEARHDRRYLYVDLAYTHYDKITHEKKYTDEVKLIAYVGELDPNELKIMVCTFLVVSRFGYPLAAEAILIKEGDIDEKAKKEIVKYLMFKRGVIRVPPRIITDVEGLKVKQNPMDDLGEIVGTYRVWNYFGDHIMQSRFTISEKFQAVFETSTYGEKGNTQTCLLDLTNILDKRRICLSAHPTKGVNTIAYIIMDIPTKERRITKGVFCSVGRRGREPAAGHIVMSREVSEDLRIGEITMEEATAMANEDKSLRKLLNTLNEVTNRKKDAPQSK